MKFNGYEIYVTNQTLPHLSAPWTRMDLGDKTFRFQRETDKSQIFSISGYIEMSDMAATRTEAEGLNNSLLQTPSGTFIDGFGTSYSVIVDDWAIDPVAGVNKYTFSMSLRIVV